jgi:hypothetical protein
MILPTKHLAADRALLTIGARILAALEDPKTVSALWDGIRKRRHLHDGHGPISYDWFILGLDLLYAIDAVRFENGLVRRSEP